MLLLLDIYVNTIMLMFIALRHAIILTYDMKISKVYSKQIPIRFVT